MGNRFVTCEVVPDNTPRIVCGNALENLAEYCCYSSHLRPPDAAYKCARHTGSIPEQIQNPCGTLASSLGFYRYIDDAKQFKFKTASVNRDWCRSFSTLRIVPAFPEVKSGRITAGSLEKLRRVMVPQVLRLAIGETLVLFLHTGYKLAPREFQLAHQS
jgi:hypothetical protein